ncbi:hypothetical protein PNOK_0289400 [Pyrrhoderma noxium]|uniref:Uncharacterized protein n=1 Tax=Pyrrhoderma noxium TaxID=2282107 RepID=A0A286UKX8_9AGAM|nr:hypothetical protein PNOK_0289400 [Pyrrhoderma noxium]
MSEHSLAGTFASSADLNWQRFWYKLGYTYENYSTRRSDGSEHIFKPEGEKQLIKNIKSQNSHLQNLGKPVVVLRSLGDQNYLVCRLTRLGGHHLHESLDPSVQFFGIRLTSSERYRAADTNDGEEVKEESSDVKSTKPLFLTQSSSDTQAVITLPLIRNDLEPLQWNQRVFLSTGQLERLERLIVKRAETFKLCSDKLRRDAFAYHWNRNLPSNALPLKIRQGLSKRISKSFNLSRRTVVTPFSSHYFRSAKTPVRVPATVVTNLIGFWYDHRDMLLFQSIPFQNKVKPAPDIIKDKLYSKFRLPEPAKYNH